MPKDFVGNWFGYDDEGSMFLLTFTEDNEAALLKRSYRGESETIWEARPEKSEQRIRFGEDDLPAAHRRVRAPTRRYRTRPDGRQYRAAARSRRRHRAAPC